MCGNCIIFIEWRSTFKLYSNKKLFKLHFLLDFVKLQSTSVHKAYSVYSLPSMQDLLLWLQNKQTPMLISLMLICVSRMDTYNWEGNEIRDIISNLSLLFIEIWQILILFDTFWWCLRDFESTWYIFWSTQFILCKSGL